jgi:hypothetical protein
MRIRGFMTVKNLLLMTLAITSVSSIASLARTLGDNTSEGNIFGPNESLEIILISGDEELQLRVTGKNTTEVVQSLKKMYGDLGKSPFSERYLLYTPQ